MYCTKCGVELQSGDNFCSKCGFRNSTGSALPGVDLQPRTLMLDKANKKIAGVCAGFARYFDVDIILMRVLWLAISICTGIGFLAYIAAWIIMPSDEGRRVPVRLLQA